MGLHALRNSFRRQLTRGASSECCAIDVDEFYRLEMAEQLSKINIVAIARTQQSKLSSRLPDGRTAVLVRLHDEHALVLLKEQRCHVRSVMSVKVPHPLGAQI